MRVTLTFDNGPTDVTPGILDTLSKHGVQATFFVLGKQLALPELYRHAQRAYEQGHRIGNHTYSHGTPFGQLSEPQEAIREIESTERLIGELAGPERLFRPSGGGGFLDARLLNPAALEYLRKHRYTIALWTSVPRDWSDASGWVGRALRDCLEADWPVVVLHDIPGAAAERLEAFLCALEERGVEFRQDFPDSVTPLVSGEHRGDLQSITTISAH